MYRRPGFNLNLLKPGKADLISALIAFPSLAMIGLAIAHAAPYFTKIPQGASVIPPSDTVTWLVLAPLCILTGYLEESFFRYYLCTRFRETGLRPITSIVVSTVMFSACHLYEGPWGVLNAALSGSLLALIFLRYRSLHGIALSHGLYNIWVYVMSAL
jgi:membrane protease YdiL (CAAX protease family)